MHIKNNNKNSSRHFSIFADRFKLQNKKTTLSARSRLSHHNYERGSILRKSLLKSRSSHNTLIASHTRFNDYGIYTKPLIKSTHTVVDQTHIHHSNKLLRTSRQSSDRKHQVNRKQYLINRHHRRNKQNKNHPHVYLHTHTLPADPLRISHFPDKYKQRNTNINMIMADNCDKSGQCLYTSISNSNNNKKQQQQLQQHGIPTQTSEIDYLPSCAQNKSNEGIDNSSGYNSSSKQRYLCKSIEQYYDMYMTSQNALQRMEYNYRQEQAKSKRIKQLYQQRVQTMARNTEAVRRNNLGHIYSYRQFPKDFIPDVVIVEYSNLQDSSMAVQSHIEGGCISQLSLISH